MNVTKEKYMGGKRIDVLLGWKDGRTCLKKTAQRSYKEDPTRTEVQ